MSNESKQSSPIGVDERVEVIAGILYANKSDEGDEGSWINSEDYYKVAKLIAGSQWASSAHPTAVNGDDYHKQRVKYIGLLESVKIALSYRDFGVLNEYLATIGENKIESPDQPKAAPKADVKSKDEIKLPYDILQDHVDPHCFLKDKCVEAVIDAMEEYANQFKG